MQIFGEVVDGSGPNTQCIGIEGSGAEGFADI